MTEVENKYKTLVNDYLMLQTMKDNKVFLTRQDFVAADKSRCYLALLWWPFTSTFISYVSNNLMMNCDITVDGIT